MDEKVHFRHIYLYAKGHYQRDPMISGLKSDLSRIIGAVCGLDHIHIPIRDIYQILCGLVYRHFKQESHFTDMMMRVLAANDEDERIYAFLCVLSVVKVRDGDTVLMDLGAADPNVLPLNEQANG